MLITSPNLTDTEVNALNLIVSNWFHVRAEPGRVILEFYSPPETGQRKLLFDYEILPAGHPNFAGTVLGTVVEDLAGTVASLYEGLKDASEEHALQRILKIINGASAAVTGRRLPQGELRILTNKIYTVEEPDWFG